MEPTQFEISGIFLSDFNKLIRLTSAVKALCIFFFNRSEINIYLNLKAEASYIIFSYSL